MVFKCQDDSFLKQFTTKIVSCEFATLNWTPPGETEIKELRGFNVVCEDTILFPEGGGQPCDYGEINGHPVRSVIRKGSEAVHFVESKQSLEVGGEARQTVNWERRLDHMQQHSGQHLITALFDREFKYDTTSWWLGSDISYIELDTRHLISRESLDFIEEKANELIRNDIPVTVMLVDPEKAEEFEDARAPRGLPKDHVGLARVVRIEGIESNMCCGTHVTNLTQLQCVKLLYAEKTKNNVLVHFAVGMRALRKLGECFQREQQLNLALKGGPKEHLDLVQKLQNNVKNTKKAFQKVLKDLAIAEAEKLPIPAPKYYCLHRKDGIEPDFINTFLRHAPEEPFYFLTVSENTGVGAKGLITLRGDPSLLNQFMDPFLAILDGKGNKKDNTFQGKFNNILKISECESLLRQYFDPPKNPKNAPEGS